MKYIFLPLIIVLMSSQVFAAKKNNKQVKAKKARKKAKSCLVQTIQQVEASKAKKLFEDSIADMPALKKFLIRKIWHKEITEGKYTFTMLTENQLQNRILGTRGRVMSTREFEMDDIQAILNKRNSKLRKVFFRPHAIGLGYETMRSIVQIAKDRGLKVGKEYLVIPAKLLATDVVDRPLMNMFYVMSFGAGGVLLDKTGILYGDPILMESEPESLEEDEVILVLNYGKPKIRKKDGNYANIIIYNEVRALQKAFPNKVLQVSLFAMDYKSRKHYAHTIKTQISEALDGRKVKQLFIHAHGLPGAIGDEASNALMSLEYLADELRSFGVHKPLTSDTEVFFTSCLLAYNTSGEISVRNFANSLMPRGSVLKVNRYVGLASLNTATKAPLVHAITREVNPIYSVMLYLQEFEEEILNKRITFNIERDNYFMSDYYEYTVGD